MAHNAVARTAVLAACLSLGGRAAGQPGVVPALELTAEQIIGRVAARSEANARTREGIAWTKTETVFDVSRSPERVKKVRVWDMWDANGTVFERLISENGRPKREDPKPLQPDFTAKLATMYRYELAEPPLQPDPVSGTMCWVIRFSPSPDASPDGIKEEIAGLMAGTLYVDASGFWIRSANGALEKPVSRRFVFTLGEASSLEFTLVQSEILGAVMTTRVVVRAEYYKAWHFWSGTEHERMERVLSDFRLLVPVDAQTPSP